MKGRINEWRNVSIYKYLKLLAWITAWSRSCVLHDFNMMWSKLKSNMPTSTHKMPFYADKSVNVNNKQDKVHISNSPAWAMFQTYFSEIPCIQLKSPCRFVHLVCLFNACVHFALFWHFRLLVASSESSDSMLSSGYSSSSSWCW